METSEHIIQNILMIESLCVFGVRAANESEVQASKVMQFCGSCVRKHCHSEHSFHGGSRLKFESLSAHHFQMRQLQLIYD